MVTLIERPAVSKGTILIIEDNSSNAEMAIDLLEDAGFTALHALDADQGIELAHYNHPNVILMDMFLPIKSGLEATHILKADPDLKKIPVVAFTAMGLDEERAQLIAEGCDGVITKPIDVSHFAEDVANYITCESVIAEAVPPQPQPVLPHVADTPAEFAEAQKVFKETISKLSHDLQSPARKIHQFCDMLLSTADTSSLSADNRMLVERIDRSSEQLLAILASSLEGYASKWRI